MIPILLALLLGCNLDAPPAYDVRAYDYWSVADVDKDGEADLVASSASEVTVAYGAAGDAFEPPRVVAAVSSANALTTADVDSDGLADLLVMSSDAPRGLKLVRNRGGRTFADPEHVMDGPIALPQAVDLDGDGDLDLAGATEDAALVTALNDGRGHFTAGPRSPTGMFGIVLRPGDFNGDGHIDLYSADFSGNARIFRGDGTGRFTLLQPVEITRDTFVATAGDLNGDGFTDLIIPERPSARIRVHFGSPAGLGAPVTYDVPATPWNTLLADLDADGDDDVIVLTSGGPLAGATFRNDGGTLTKIAEIPGGIAGLSTLLGDTNRDGLVDLLIGAGGLGGTVAVANGLGGGRFRAPEVRTIGAEHFSRIADIDADGAGDLLAVDRNPTILTITYANGRSEQIAIPERNFGIDAIEATNAPGLELVIAEKDVLTIRERRFGQWSVAMTVAGTGFPRDVVAADARHLAVVWTRDRDAVIETYVLALPDGSRWSATLAPSVSFGIVARDFTGDGLNDLLVTGSGTFPGVPHDFTPLSNGFLSLFTGRGDGTFGDERRILSDKSFVAADAGDFDGDGDADIVVGMQRGGDVVVLRNDGRGAFGAAEVIAEDAERNNVRYATGDLNGDGIDDLVTSSSGTVLTLRFGAPGGFVVRPQVLGRGYSARIANGRLSLLGSNTLTTFGLTCDDGRRRATGR